MAQASPPAGALGHDNTPLTISAAITHSPVASILTPPASSSTTAAAAAAATAAVIAARTELASIFGLLLLVIALRTRLTIARALRAVHRPANLWLLLHIAISFFELGRLQWRALPGHPVCATPLDLALGLAHCLSSYQVLMSRTRAGYKDLIPLGLRVQPFLFRLVATVLAFASGSPGLHRANIRLGFDSFLYARLLIFLCTKLSPVISLGGPRALHTFAAVLGGFLATWDSGFRHGSPAYIICSAVSILLDSRTAGFMARVSETPQEPKEAHDIGATQRQVNCFLTRLHKIVTKVVIPRPLVSDATRARQLPSTKVS